MEDFFPNPIHPNLLILLLFRAIHPECQYHQKQRRTTCKVPAIEKYHERDNLVKDDLNLVRFHLDIFSKNKTPHPQQYSKKVSSNPSSM